MDTDQITTRREEVADYKEVWTAIGGLWGPVEAMADTNLSSSQPIKMIKGLEGVVEAMSELPNKLRSFDPYLAKKDELRHLSKQTRTLNDLRTEAFKERHWEDLLKKINLPKRYNELTVGQIWDHNLLKYEKPINSILSKATGEYVLEEMIKKVKSFW